MFISLIYSLFLSTLYRASTIKKIRNGIEPSAKSSSIPNLRSLTALLQAIHKTTNSALHVDSVMQVCVFEHLKMEPLAGLEK